LVTLSKFSDQVDTRNPVSTLMAPKLSKNHHHQSLFSTSGSDTLFDYTLLSFYEVMEIQYRTFLDSMKERLHASSWKKYYIPFSFPYILIVQPILIIN
jgi:hypothetical protein